MTDSVKLSLRDVHKSFGSKAVLRGVDLDIETNQSVVIIGGSGTGKSVILKSILGLIHPDSGQILLEGQRIDTASGRERDKVLDKIGMLFQGGALFDSLKVWENVAFRLPADKSKMSRAQAKDWAVEKLKRVGLSGDVADQMPVELSGGMQKRVGLARAIASEPEIIFFDEPTTGLDPIMSGVINELIRTIVSEMGVTAVTITHDMSSVHAIADKVAMLYDGKILWTGNVEEMQSTDNPYVQQFTKGSHQGPIPTLR